MKSPRIAIALTLAATPLLVLIGATSAGATQVYPATEYDRSAPVTTPVGPAAAHPSPQAG
ncbi:hypothetical protein [Embleya hyalina]|uniref:Uncharacterized protein n=1 Tax=Embleya hyalina TaxID=516124 RepID=A0A401YMD2_9ACTN|nr:hypothetical protein [Embleya hyalina]GCD95774.1 hypothetical protein EHYA_03457 [Embleya hyalina]